MTTIETGKWHLRYNPRSAPLFSGLGEPTVHAVYDETIKTLCGRDAYDFWRADIVENAMPTCQRCQKKIAAFDTLGVE